MSNKVTNICIIVILLLSQWQMPRGESLSEKVCLSPSTLRVPFGVKTDTHHLYPWINNRAGRAAAESQMQDSELQGGQVWLFSRKGLLPVELLMLRGHKERPCRGPWQSVDKSLICLHLTGEHKNSRKEASPSGFFNGRSRWLLTHSTTHPITYWQLLTPPILACAIIFNNIAMKFRFIFFTSVYLYEKSPRKLQHEGWGLGSDPSPRELLDTSLLKPSLSKGTISKPGFWETSGKGHPKLMANMLV